MEWDVRQVKIQLICGKTPEQSETEQWADRWDWKNFHREPWGSWSEYEHRDTNVYATEQRVISQLVQLLQNDHVQKGKMKIEFDHMESTGVLLPDKRAMTNSNLCNKMLDGTTKSSWGVLDESRPSMDIPFFRNIRK
ncbi:hypothetical protein MMC34_000289 [Xylographa carneopallida]|nr:hypothetical protein [Xylographa carneopallida]